MRTNKKVKFDRRKDKEVRLAGGFGNAAAVQTNEALLRRAVMSCLLWEDVAYMSGADVAGEIERLVPLVGPSVVAEIAIESRLKQGLRHVSLFIVVEMCKYDGHRKFVREVVNRVVTRVDQMAEMVSLYWRNGKKQIPKQMRLGIADCFSRFDEYQFGKYKGENNTVSLRDVMFLCRPKPIGEDREKLYKRIANKELATPNTWETRLSSGEDKKSVWGDLIRTGRIGGLAFLRNLRNMESVGVDRDVVAHGFRTINPGWLLPINYIVAARENPRWEAEIETLMFSGLSGLPKLPGRTICVVDVSGSMGMRVSSKSTTTRMDAASSMAVIAREMCEDVVVYATAGEDWKREHSTSIVPTRRGFGLSSAVAGMTHELGNGGIFTRQCLEYIRGRERDNPDRIIVFSDSQDCDYPDKRIPAPFGIRNYIVDVSAHTRGIGYKGAWDAEISGWSQHFLGYIAAYEGLLGKDDLQ